MIVSIVLVFPIIDIAFRDGQDIGDVELELVFSQVLVVEILSGRKGAGSVDQLLKIIFCIGERQIRKLYQQDESFPFGG